MKQGTWILCTRHFNLPMAILVIGIRHHLADVLKLELDNDASTEEMAKGLQKIIEQHRPDLAGCIVVGIDFSLARRTYDVCVVHKSLPPILPGAYTPRQHLDRCAGCKCVIDASEGAEVYINSKGDYCCGQHCSSK